MLGDAAEIEGSEVGNSTFATYDSSTSKDSATVAVYPKNTPMAVIGISSLAIRSLILNDKYRSKVTPKTQPTWGRALKAKTIDARNPHAVENETFLFN